MTRRTSTALTNATFDETLPGAGNLCTYLDWDSDFFGKRIARLNISQPTHFDLSQASTWCLSNRIDCLYLLAEADDSETGGLACQNNFLEVDVRLTLARPISQEDRLSPLAADSRIRSARESDLAAVRRLARTLHRDTRFYSDPRFERFHCDLLYETWISKSFEDPDQTVFVPDVDGQPAGYIACNLRNQEGQIGLLGVADTHAGKGLGKALTHRFLSWCAQHGARQATVVTQARNHAARGLYQSCGFRTSSTQRWYHRWFTT